MSLGVTQESHADCADLSEWEGEEAFVAVQGAARRPLSLVESAVFDVVDLHDRVGSGEVEGETLSGDEEGAVALVDDQAERPGVAGSGGDRAWFGFAGRRVDPHGLAIGMIKTLTWVRDASSVWAGMGHEPGTVVTSETGLIP
jgi:hypothetical protein